MRMKYEVWRYSESWGKWIRDIYFDIGEAQRRYELLQKNGKRAKRPQPMNEGLTMFEKLSPHGRKVFLAGAVVLLAMTVAYHWMT